MSDTFTLYKLIILYMLHKVDFPLTTSQISEFILEKGYTDYFKLQQSLSELQDAALIREEVTHNRTLFHLTEEGRQALQFFQRKISPAIIEDIDTFLKEKAYELKDEVSVKANYYRNTRGEYQVHCVVMEDTEPLIDLKLTVPTETEAETIAANWYRQNQTVYASILEHLLQNNSRKDKE